jgi:hypothetical protein
MQKLLLVLAIVIAVVAVTASTAATRLNDRAVVRVGKCTGSSMSKLKLKRDNNLAEIELEVDENKVGRRWRVVIARNGRSAFVAVKKTVAPSGSFNLSVKISGRGRYSANARELTTGEVCRASATI